MAGQYLIDTNTVIDYLDKKLPANGANMLYSARDKTVNYLTWKAA